MSWLSFFWYQMSEASKHIRYEGGTVRVRAIFNRKSSANVLCLKYNTKEDRLLYVILEKFIAEKVLDCGLNINNQITSGFATNKGIVVTVPDNKIFSVIAQIQRYILNTTLNITQQKIVGSGSYSRLYKDIGTFDAMIIGKCRLTERALGNSRDKKIENFVRAMDAIAYRDKDDFDANAPYEIETIKGGSLNAAAKLAFAVCYSHLPFYFEGNDIKLLSPTALSDLEERAVYKNSFQGKVKAFQTQFGNVGSPSSNDAGQKKFKEKCKLIQESVNFMAEIYGALHGFNYHFSNLDAIKSVDSEAIAAAKSVKIKV